MKEHPVKVRGGKRYKQFYLRWNVLWEDQKVRDLAKPPMFQVFFMARRLFFAVILVSSIVCEVPIVFTL
jgi:hypothetical protein